MELASQKHGDMLRSLLSGGLVCSVVIRVLSSFVFCHHSCREAVLRGLTSASLQANALIVMFSRHEADLGGLTSASRQILKQMRGKRNRLSSHFVYTNYYDPVLITPVLR